MNISVLPYRVQIFSGSQMPLNPRGRGIKRPERETRASSTSSIEAKKAQFSAATPSYSFISWCLRTVKLYVLHFLKNALKLLLSDKL